jgi:hypothetical protein
MKKEEKRKKEGNERDEGKRKRIGKWEKRFREWQIVAK